MDNQGSFIDLYNTCYDIFKIALRFKDQEIDLAKELYKNTSGDTVKQTSILKKSINELLIKYFDPESVNSQSPGGRSLSSPIKNLSENGYHTIYKEKLDDLKENLAKVEKTTKQHEIMLNNFQEIFNKNIKPTSQTKNVTDKTSNKEGIGKKGDNKSTQPKDIINLLESNFDNDSPSKNDSIIESAKFDDLISLNSDIFVNQNKHNKLLYDPKTGEIKFKITEEKKNEIAIKKASLEKPDGVSGIDFCKIIKDVQNKIEKLEKNQSDKEEKIKKLEEIESKKKYVQVIDGNERLVRGKDSKILTLSKSPNDMKVTPKRRHFDKKGEKKGKRVQYYDNNGNPKNDSTVNKAILKEISNLNRAFNDLSRNQLHNQQGQANFGGNGNMYPYHSNFNGQSYNNNMNNQNYFPNNRNQNKQSFRKFGNGNARYN